MRSVTEVEFASVIAAAEVPVLIDFWAPWCRPCLAIAQPLAEIADALSGRLEVLKVDVDESPALARRLGICSVPTLVVFRHGEVVETVVGALPKRELLRWLEKLGIGAETHTPTLLSNGVDHA